MLKDTLKSFYIVLFVVMSALALTSCSDDDDDDLPLTFVRGTAATGAPIVGTVTLVDVNGDMSDTITINADGSFTIPVFGLEPPFMLEAEAANSETFYSYAERWGVANITELTSLAIYMASGSDPQALFNNWDTLNGSLSESSLETAAQIIYGNLQTQYADAGLDATDWDFFTALFNADGTGLDAVLDAVDAEVQGSTIVVTDANGSPITFDPNFDITTIEFDGGTISFGVDNDGGVNVDVDQDVVDGNYDLTITGTVTTAGIPVTFSGITVNNIPAPTSAAQVETAVGTEFDVDTDTTSVSISNLSVTQGSGSGGQIVYDVSFTLSTTVTDPIQITTTAEYDLTYTYTPN